MNATEAKLSSPEVVDLTPEEARKGLLEIFAKAAHVGGPLKPEAWTFCQCCGSQYINSKGEVGNSTISQWIKPGFGEVEAYYKKRYGVDGRTRVGAVAWDNMLKLGDRKNLPGITAAYLPLKEAITILYDEAHAPQAQGYEINDKDQGHVVSVLWTDA